MDDPVQSPLACLRLVLSYAEDVQAGRPPARFRVLSKYAGLASAGQFPKEVQRSLRVLAAVHQSSVCGMPLSCADLQATFAHLAASAAAVLKAHGRSAA